MTDRSPMTDPLATFEASLARRLEAYADVPSRRVEAHVQMAVRAATLARRRGRFWPLPIFPVLRPAVLIGLLLALAAAAALGAGMLLKEDPPLPGRLVFSSSSGGLYLADADGLGAHKVQSGQFGTPRWSFDGRYIAVLRTPNSIDILRADGTMIEEVPGGGAPVDFAWAPGPDGATRLAALIDGALVIKDMALGVSVRVTADADQQISGTWGWASGSTLIWNRIPWRQPHDVYEIVGVRIDPVGSALTASPIATRQWNMPSPPVHESFGHVTLSPDGTTLATNARLYGVLAGDLGIIPVEGGLMNPVATHIQIRGWLEWSADSRAIIVESFGVGERTQLFVVPLGGGATYPLFDQGRSDSWLIIDDSPVDLAHGQILMGKATDLTSGTRFGDSAPVVDLHVLDPGALRPRLIAESVLGADVFRP